MCPDPGDIVFRVLETLLSRFFLVVVGTVAVHVALADERALTSAVADSGEEFRRRVNRAVPAARGGTGTNHTLDDRVVDAAGIRSIRKLRIERGQESGTGCVQFFVQGPTLASAGKVRLSSQSSSSYC